MAKVFINAHGQLDVATNDNHNINDHTVGKGNWVFVPDSEWISVQGNNNNKIINGTLVPSHIPDRHYWLDGMKYTLVHPEPLPEGASFEKPSNVLAQEERALRDELLRQSDWAVLPDTPLSDEKRQEWMAYRQALRDMPQQSGFPEQVVMPEVPVK